MKKRMALLLTICLILSGCGSKANAVYVQSVEVLSSMGGIAPGDHFLGLVVSEHVTEIKKDSDKAVEELLVKEGDDVKKDQELFSYDTDELQLNYDKKVLELDQLKASIESYKSQIRQLETERADRDIVMPDYDMIKPAEFGGKYWRREKLKALFPEDAKGIDEYLSK